MPTYSYRCQSCGQALDVYRPMTDSSVKILCRCTGVFQRVFNDLAFLDRPTSPPILRDPISAGYPGSKYPPITQARR